MPDDTITEARISAIESALSDLAKILDNTPPVGSINFLAHDDLDDDRYLRCEGQSIDTTLPENERYLRLFRKIGLTYGGSGTTFNLPDLRGEFPRFLDSGRGVDIGRKLGQPQEYRTGLPQDKAFIATNAGGHTHSLDSAGGHSHGINMETGASRLYQGDGNQTNNTCAWPLVGNRPQTDGAGNHTHNVNAAPDHSHPIAGGDHETAPRNVALVGCIRM